MTADKRITGATLRAERKAQGLVVSDLAARFREVAPPHVRLPDREHVETTIRGHERGAHAVSERYKLLYCLALGKPEEELFPAPPPLEKRPAAVTVEEPGSTDWGDMERRLLLQMAALGIGAGALQPGETARHLVDLAMTTDPRDLDDWHLACGDHLHAIRTRPPAQARQDLVVDLLALGRQIDTADAADLTELQRVKAALSTLHANALTRLGDHGAAIRWWRTAKAAADATGDLQLRLLVCGSEAGFGLYGQRSPETVLHLTRRARRLASDKPSLGLALITKTEAKALSLLGRHTEAQETMRGVTDATPDDSLSTLLPTYWTPDQVHFTESWVYAGSGNEAGADEARERVLVLAFDYQYHANVRLHEALCTVVNGGTDQGAHLAATLLDSLPAAHRSQMITETGNTVLRAVPYGQQDRPAVRALREVLAKTAPKPALPSAT
ncbi:hypothetical protein GCM10010191_01230 [Actinomadura vinacea]|uniref:XRE family transcriptional regulator n=1 Tax=Actinomadura vinacea TaxID=115336 RepID=A0ABP5VAX2_9ACTN